MNGFLAMLLTTATTISSKSGNALSTIDSWPLVNGSNDPWNMATRLPPPLVHCDVFIAFYH